MSADVFVLRPSGFAGVVLDADGRGWALLVEPSGTPGWVIVSGHWRHARWSALFDFVDAYFTFITPGAHAPMYGRGDSFFRRVGECLMRVAIQFPEGRTPRIGAHAVLARAACDAAQRAA